MKGVVKFFDPKKGWGFLTPEAGNEVFVHFSSIQAEGFRTLYEGDKVEFDLVSLNGKEQAGNVVVTEKAKRQRGRNKQEQKNGDEQA